MSGKYNKLVRDKIPEKIKNNNEIPIVKVLNDTEYFKELKLKLFEELNEYLSSDDIEELADLEEVIYAILKCKNVSISDFEKIRKEKTLKNGSFDERLFLIDVKKGK